MESRPGVSPCSTLWNRPFVLCLMLQAFYMFSFNMVTPLIAGFVVDLGESITLAGFVAGIFSVLAFAFRPIVGYLSDIVNRKRIMTIGLILCVIGIGGYAVSANVAMVLLFRVIHAFALCVQTTLVTVIAADFTPQDRIAEGVGYVGIAAMLGMSLGPGAGVIISDFFDYRATFAVGAALMALSIAVFAGVPNMPLPPRKKEAVKFSLRSILDVDAIPLSISVMSFAYCAGLTSTFLVLLGTSRGIDGIAAFFLVSSLGMVLVRPAAGRHTDRHGLGRLLPGCFIAEAVNMVCLAFSASLVGVIVGAVGRTFGQGVAQSSLQGQTLKDAAPENRGVASSTFYLGVDVGQGMGALAGGVLVDYAGYQGAMLSGPVLLVIGAASFFMWQRAHRKRAQS